MDGKDKEKMVITTYKPVASRPSNLKLLSRILNSAFNDSPSTSMTEATIVIRPENLSFEPSRFVTSQDDASEPVVCCASNSKAVIYKPKAKLVANTTATHLASLGNFDHYEYSSAEMKAQFQVPGEAKDHFCTQPASNLQDNLPLNLGMGQDKGIHYDGYHWRKYGKKQVKGSEYPRSYYKCSHPKCPVKKKVETSVDGETAEIVYEGDHNHPKQKQQSKNRASGLQQTDSGDLSWINHFMEKNAISDNRNEVDLSSGPIHSGIAHILHNPCEAGTYDGGVEADTFCAEHNRKKRKRKDQAQVGSEPQNVAQSSRQYDVSGDGFHWRKYGQKVVNRNPYPRSYYRCSTPKCRARKHVERASDDPRSIITTYEGKHNHEKPVKDLNPTSSSGPNSGTN